MKYLMVLWLIAFSVHAKHWTDFHDKFDTQRFNIFEANLVSHNCDLYGKKIKTYSKQFSECLSHPTDQRATSEERLHVLKTLGVEAIFRRTNWLEEEIIPAVKGEMDHFDVLNIMKHTIQILIKDPLAMINSGTIYSYLTNKLTAEFPILKNHESFKETLLTHIIPQEFFKDFLTKLINSHFLRPIGDRWELEGLSLEALTALAFQSEDKSVTLVKEEGFLCSPTKGKAKSLEELESQEGSIYKFEQLPGTNTYQLMLGSSGSSFQAFHETYFSKLVIDEACKKLFYTQEALSHLSKKYPHGYYYDDSLMGVPYKLYDSLDEIGISSAKVIGKFLTHYQSFKPLTSFTYFPNLPYISQRKRIIPLTLGNLSDQAVPEALKVLCQSLDEDELRQILEDYFLSHVNDESVDKVSELKALVNRFKNINIPQELDSLKRAVKEFLEAKQHEYEEIQRKRDEEAHRARIEKENRNILRLLGNTAHDSHNFYNNLFAFIVEILTNKIDHFSWQARTKSEVNPIAFTPEEERTFKPAISHYVDTFKQNHTRENTMKEVEEKIEKMIKNFFNHLTADINSDLTQLKFLENQDYYSLKEKHALGVKDKWKDLVEELEAQLWLLKRRELPKKRINPAAILEGAQTYKGAWTGKEGIMNVLSYFKRFYIPKDLIGNPSLEDASLEKFNIYVASLIKDMNLKFPPLAPSVQEALESPCLKSLELETKKYLITQCGRLGHFSNKDNQFGNLANKFIYLVSRFQAIHEALSSINKNLARFIDKETIQLATIGQFKLDMEAQVGNCGPGFRTRLLLAESYIAIGIEELYQAGF